LPPSQDTEAIAEKERLQRDIQELQSKNRSLEEERNRLEMIATETNLAAAQKIREAEQKTKRLHKIILESGLNQIVPIDEEVQTAFNQLQNRIFQLVKKYCTKHEGSKSKLHESLKDEYKDLYVMSFIANRLWEEYFADDARLFGFDMDTDGQLAHFESNVESEKRGMSTVVCNGQSVTNLFSSFRIRLD
jgi:hypothetical protein